MTSRTRIALLTALVTPAALGLGVAAFGLPGRAVQDPVEAVAPPVPPSSTGSPARKITAPKGLTPGTARAFVDARTAAAEEGLPLELTSGYRTPAEQRAEFDEAVRKYGSAEKASQYVLPPEKSAHVKGTAVDIRPQITARWLEREGTRFGLCRIYANEWWHFEYSASYRNGTCPPLKQDARG